MKPLFSSIKLRKVVLIVVLAVILALSFLAYLQASFVVDLANRFILC